MVPLAVTAYVDLDSIFGSTFNYLYLIFWNCENLSTLETYPSTYWGWTSGEGWTDAC